MEDRWRDAEKRVVGRRVLTGSRLELWACSRAVAVGVKSRD